MANKIRDFDRFLAEREETKIIVRVFGRDCEVPAELPWVYMLKVENMLQNKSPISGADNLALFKQMFSEDDYNYVINHPEFRASTVWNLIAFTWLHADDAPDKPSEPVFKTEDDVKIEKTQSGAPKKSRSAR